MNNQTYAVLQKNNSTLSVFSQNDQYYWDMLQSGYEVVETGTKRYCERFVEDYLSELSSIED